MRTTIDIDVEALDELVRLAGAPSRAAVLAESMKALREKLASQRLAEMYEAGVTFPEADSAPRRRF
jgi:hypothetical protein